MSGSCVAWRRLWNKYVAWIVNSPGKRRGLDWLMTENEDSDPHPR